MERSVERRYEKEDFVGKMLGTGQDGGECCGKAIGEVNPSTLGKTTSLNKRLLFFVVLRDIFKKSIISLQISNS